MARWRCAALAAALAACSAGPPAAAPGRPGGSDPPASTAGSRTVTLAPSPEASDPATDNPDADPEPPAVRPRPAWLGSRILPLRPDGFGEVRPTPRVLRDRRLQTPTVLPPPPDGRFRSTVRRPPRGVVRRSTWSPRCPVALEDLRYVTVTFLGFDGHAHTGELLVNAVAADDVVSVFRRLYRARFPIEEMRVVAAEELDLPPTGDGNNTTAFVCRPSRTTAAWSRHAFGLAVDVNPFHNPYVRGDVVLPELASAYVDRGNRRPGMHHRGGPAVKAFAAIGWGWGGSWRSLKDWMHFSSDGR